MSSAYLFHVVRGEGLEPPVPLKAARLQRAGIAAIRSTHWTDAIISHLREQ